MSQGNPEQLGVDQQQVETGSQWRWNHDSLDDERGNLAWATLAAIRRGPDTAVPRLFSLGHMLLYSMHDYRFD